MENDNSVEASILNEGVEEENDKFSWNPRATKLLLSAYKEKKALFRDPKVKKKHLWEDIKNVFLNNGYYVSEDILDKKFRNMKSHFKTVKNNAKKKKGRISWEYFEDMNYIFEDDKTMKTDEVISSMNMAIKRDADDDKESIIIVYSADPQPSTSTAEAEAETPSILPTVPVTAKSLSKYTSVMLDLDTRRVVALEKIAKTLEGIKDVQKQRNNLIRSLSESKKDEK
ncbi:uncharacterized protein LOC114324587 [Diabrotica virgifera virgifera]|uniref:Uncharacterized protein LOC114324587 n=1 Tax=Diabrotica virgifera virgifera TaxID=50390 RepID=A0A6P7EYE0_DIAVI|nr:uncharacterized protein LOC114324587 [Diabrotica virgifera virgifera]